MNIQTFIVSWDNVLANVDTIAEQLQRTAASCTVLNSGTPVQKKHWLNIGDVQFYNQLHEAVSRFDLKNDVLLFVLGDARFYDWVYFLNRVRFVFENLNVGIYAPHFDNSPWGPQQTQLGSLDLDGNLLISSQSDGIVVALHRSIVVELRAFFARLYAKRILPAMRTGWGMDYVWCVLSLLQKKHIIRDSSLVFVHPQGSSYDHGEASHNMAIILEHFSQFLPEAQRDAAAHYIAMIQQRMAGNISADSFFLESFPRYAAAAPIPYHIITVSDKRANHVTEMTRILGEDTRISLACVNAYDPTLDLSVYPPVSYLRQGEIGCYASHYLFWKYVVAQDLPYALVLEDDAQVSHEFWPKVAIGLRAVPTSFDVFSVFVHHNQHDRYTRHEQETLVTTSAYQDWSTLCYVVSQKGARALIARTEALGMCLPVDWFIFRSGHAGIFENYTFRPHVHVPVSIDTAAPASIIR